MVARLLRLRCALVLGALREDRALALRSALAALVLLATSGLIAWLFLAAADAGEGAPVVTVVGSCAALLWFALPFFGSAGDPLDARKFLVFGVDGEKAALPVLVASLVSVPTLALTVMAVTAVVAWSSSGTPLVIAILAALAAVVTCVLFARLGFALSARLLPERRPRELNRLLVLLLVLALVPFAVFAASLLGGGRVPEQFRELGAVLAFTPLGAAWSAPFVAEGEAGILVALISLASAGALFWGWRRLFVDAASRADRVRQIRADAGLGWFAAFPANGFGAISARSILYWTQDRRYLVNLLIVPVVGAVSVVPLLVAGVPSSIAALVPVPIMALLLGWLPHNDTAYDSSALWMHVSAGVRGIADRAGRLVPVIILGLVLLATATPVAVAFHGDWSYLAPLTGVVLCLFLSALGLSSVASALAPYPVSRPGDSPFVQPQRTGATSFWSQSLVILGALAATFPSGFFAWDALWGGSAASMAGAFVWGVGIGAGVLIVGVAVGSVAFERRRHALMDFATAQ